MRTRYQGLCLRPSPSVWYIGLSLPPDWLQGKVGLVWRTAKVSAELKALADEGRRLLEEMKRKEKKSATLQ
jgi:hypothetical protein